jgi:hypothetical protein
LYYSKNITNILLTSLIYVPSDIFAQYDIKLLKINSQYSLEKTFENLFNMLNRIKQTKKIIDVLNGNLIDELLDLGDYFDINSNTTKKADIETFFLLMKLFILKEFLFSSNLTFVQIIEKIKTDRNDYFSNMEPYRKLFDTMEDLEEFSFILIFFEKYFPSRWLSNFSLIKEKQSYILFKYFKEFWSPNFENNWLKISNFTLIDLSYLSDKIIQDKGLFFMIYHFLNKTIPIENYFSDVEQTHILNILDNNFYYFLDLQNLLHENLLISDIKDCFQNYIKSHEERNFDSYGLYIFLNEYLLLVDLFLFEKYYFTQKKI